MKLSTFIFLIFAFEINGSIAQTTIPSGNVSGTWTKANSPYLVQGEITIAKGNTLTLEPGTIVEFNGNYGLTVDGVLNSVGAKGDSIQFKATSGFYWGGISFYKNAQMDTIKFNYCRFDNIGEGNRQYYANVGIYIYLSSPLVVKNTAFYHSYKNVRQYGAIYALRNVAIIDSIRIYSNASQANSFGLISLDSTYNYSITNIITNIKNDVNSVFSINVFDSHSSLTKGVISNIQNAPGSFIVIALARTKNAYVSNINLNGISRFILSDLKNCKFNKISIKNTPHSAIATYGTFANTIIEDCHIENCGSYINSFYTFSVDVQSSGPLFNNCIFKSNKTGLQVAQDSGAGTPIFLNCQFSGFQSYGCFIEGYPVFVNCNFQDNYNYKYWPGTTDLNRPYVGGITVIREQYNSRPYFYNCLLWGNKDSFGHYNSIVLVDKVVKADLNYCLVQGDSSNGVAGLNDADRTSFRPTSPQLTYLNSSGLTPGFVDSVTGNYQLLNTCTKMGGAINKGMRGNLLTQYPFNILNNTYGINIYNATDLAGNPRVVDDTLDVGCYESQGNKRVLKVQSTISDTSICYGANLSVQSKTTGYVQNYNWQEKQGSTITNVSNSKTLNLVNAKAKNNQYRLVLSSTGCLPLKDSSNWFTVQVKNPIKKGIVKNPNKDSIQLNETMLLSTGATGYNSFAWSNGASTSSTSFKGSDLGSLGAHQITLEARNINGCLETDTVYIYTKANSSIHQSLNQAGIKLYPSPANTILNIECNEPLSIEIYDLNGQLLFSQNTESNASQLNIEELKQGVYFVKLRRANMEELVVKLIKD